jgi:ATP-dependent DNA helicase RecQ
MPAENIIEKFNGERAQFVKTILDNSRTAKTWTQVDIHTMVTESGFDRQRILTALEYFHEKKWIDLKPKSSVEVFEILDPEFDIDAMAQKFADLFIEKEKKDIARIHEMIALFETGQCLAKSLSAYFGEILDGNCRRCSVCMEKEPVKLLSSALPSLAQQDFHALVKPLMDVSGSPMPAALVTRFLCGISSPRLVEVKRRKTAGFGRLDAYPYKMVEKWVRSNTAFDV